jgi:hypothetical protein
MIHTPKIEFMNYSDRASEMQCPRCGGGNLNHLGATFYDRSEDERQEVVIEVLGAQTTTTVRPHSDENPSSRRHGMVIHFDCELCSGTGGRLQLTIAQHKGCTDVGWRFDPVLSKAE